MIYRFAGCVLDCDQFQLTHNDRPVHVEPQVFDLLRVLVERAGEVVSKDTLLEEVWNNLAVSDATINARVSAARKAVGDDGSRQAVIRTLQRRGFSLIAPVACTGDVSPSSNAGISNAVNVRYAKAKGGPAIAWTDHGSGPEMIRIGHWLSHLERDRHSPIFGPLIAHLSSRHRLISYDVRGTGMSARAAPIESLDQFVDDLDAVARVATSGPAILMASSQAAPVAISYAVRHPDRVRGLILAGGFAQGRARRPMQDGELDEATAQSMIRSGWGKAGSVFLEGFARLFAPDGTVDEIADLATMQSASVDAETAITLRHVVDRFDATDFLASVSVPTLILHARGDVIHPLSQGQILAAEIPMAQLVTLEGRNHVLLPSSAAWPHAMAAIDGFIDTLP